MLAQADADEAVIESGAGGAALPRLSNQTPDNLRVTLPQPADAGCGPWSCRTPTRASRPRPRTSTWRAWSATWATRPRSAFRPRRRPRRSIQPINVLLPKALASFQKAVAAWQAVLNDVAADIAYVNAGAPPAQNPALISRKVALVDTVISPALLSLQDLLNNYLIPYQNTSIAQSDPTNTGDGYATLYTQKIALYQQALRRVQQDPSLGAGVRRSRAVQRGRRSLQHREPAQDLRFEPGHGRRGSTAGDAGPRSQRHDHRGRVRRDHARLSGQARRRLPGRKSGARGEHELRRGADQRHPRPDGRVERRQDPAGDDLETPGQSRSDLPQYVDAG